MDMQGGAPRAPRWGADLPADEAQARERLLHAAETCYARYGPSRTKMTHIAAEAGVHRTTVYSYFPNRDAVLAACFVRAVADVVAAANPYFESDEPFSERLVSAILVGLDAARNSPAMKMLIGDDELSQTHRAAEASEIWRNDVQAGFAERFADAAAAGEVRNDVPPNTLAHWVTRICFSLIAEPGKPEYGGDEGLIRTFLPAALAPLPT
jgi:AcrR family transcriptional regulator